MLQPTRQVTDSVLRGSANSSSQQNTDTKSLRFSSWRQEDALLGLPASNTSREHRLPGESTSCKPRSCNRPWGGAVFIHITEIFCVSSRKPFHTDLQPLGARLRIYLLPFHQPACFFFFSERICVDLFLCGCCHPLNNWPCPHPLYLTTSLHDYGASALIPTCLLNYHLQFRDVCSPVPLIQYVPVYTRLPLHPALTCIRGVLCECTNVCPTLTFSRPPLSLTLWC